MSSNSSKTKVQAESSRKSSNGMQLKESKFRILESSKNLSAESILKPTPNVFEGLDLGRRLTLKNEEIQESVRNTKLMIDRGLGSKSNYHPSISQENIPTEPCATSTKNFRMSAETVHSPPKGRKFSSFDSNLIEANSQSKSNIPGTFLKSTESIHNFAFKPSLNTSQSTTTLPGGSVEKSMLVTGFGMRNVESLQRALLNDDQRHQLLYHKYDKDNALKCESYETFSTSSKSSSKFTEEASQSELVTDVLNLHQQQLDYLMGLTGGGEEEGVQAEIGQRGVFDIEDADEEGATGTTMAMRKAQKFLRSHKIFEFFQFLIAHMLSALPENPIKFLLELLDKCLIYRSGLGHPPLLFEKQHLEQLFYLMDRLRTGFIEVQQYKTGMVTLGICSYGKNPPLSPDGMVAKDIFITEAYDCLTDLFHDMIRRRKGKFTPPSVSIVTPPPTLADLSSVGSGQ